MNTSNVLHVYPEMDNYLKVKRYRNVTNTIPHKHLHWEIVLFETSGGEHIINDIAYPVSARDIVLLAPSDLHFHRFCEGSSHNCIKVDFPHNRYTSPMDSICRFDHFPVSTNLCPQDYETALFIFQLLLNEYDNPDLTGSQKVSENLIELLLILIKRNLPDPEDNCPQDSAFSHRILMYLQTHFCEPITIVDVAKDANYSPKYFSMLFLREFGTPFQDYLRSMRMNHAFQLVKYTNQPIAEICYKSGFQSTTYFSKLFKKKYGKSPNKLRTQSRQA